MTELASLRAERDDGLVIAAVDGEIDPSNAREVGRKLHECVPNDAMGVILDLSDVAFLDSSGVQMIFELAERLDSRQQRLAVVVPEDAPARRVLDIVSLDAIAPLVSTRDEAAERLAG